MNLKEVKECIKVIGEDKKRNEKMEEMIRMADDCFGRGFDEEAEECSVCSVFVEVKNVRRPIREFCKELTEEGKLKVEEEEKREIPKKEEETLREETIVGDVKNSSEETPKKDVRKKGGGTLKKEEVKKSEEKGGGDMGFKQGSARAYIADRLKEGVSEDQIAKELVEKKLTVNEKVAIQKIRSLRKLLREG